MDVFVVSDDNGPQAIFAKVEDAFIYVGDILEYCGWSADDVDNCLMVYNTEDRTPYNIDIDDQSFLQILRMEVYDG